MVPTCQKTGLCHVNNIYEVDSLFKYIVEILRNPTRKKNRGVTGSLFSVEWIEDERQRTFAVARQACIL